MGYERTRPDPGIINSADDYKIKSRILARAITNLNEYGESGVARALAEHFSTSPGGTKGWAQKNGILFSIEEYRESLTPGMYSCGVSNEGQPFLISEDIVTDDLLILPGSKMTNLIQEFDRFWSLEDTFNSQGFIHKRGFFFVGPPGSGKTSIIQLLAQKLISEHEGIVLYLDNPTVAFNCLRMIRSVEPERKIICILEDLDSLIKNYEEADFLSLFDGEKQINHVVYIATTNYPEVIDKRFLDRPSRFDQVVVVDLPPVEDRLFYLQNRSKDIDQETLELWAKKTEGFGIAHLKEIIVSTQCFGYSFEDTLTRLKQQKKTLSSDKIGGKKGVGFKQE